MSTETVRPRPSLFQALGSRSLPETIEIGEKPYRLQRILKHDSWAATALYAGDQLAVVKFNRIQPIFGLPMQWLGRMLAKRERGMLRLFGDLPNIPGALGRVTASGVDQPTAVAREFVPGHPLSKYELVNDDFFPSLSSLLDRIHKQRVAYVDLQKHENVIVGDDGAPYLVDFQISFAAPRGWLGSVGPFRWLLALLQRSDNYHVQKHFARCRPDLFDDLSCSQAARPPWWIRLHRKLFRPFTLLRRQILIFSRVRTSAGRADSEWFPEDAHRPSFAGNAKGTHELGPG